MLLINFEINLVLTWSENCVISSATGKTKFAITDTTLCVRKKSIYIYINSMFAIYNKMTRGSLIIFFLWIYLYYIYIFVFLVFLLLFFFFPLPNSYLTLVITLLLLLLQLCLLILPLTVFLRNQAGESSKQGIQAAWSTPIPHVK